MVTGIQVKADICLLSTRHKSESIDSESFGGGKA